MHTMRRSSVVVTTTPGLLPTELAVAEGGDLGQGFMTRPLFTEPHRRRSRKMNGSAESPEYPRHLLLIVRPERGGSPVAQRADLQEVGAQVFVVRCLEDGDHVVGSYRPVSLLQLQPMLLGDLPAGERYRTALAHGRRHGVDSSGVPAIDICRTDERVGLPGGSPRDYTRFC